VRMSSLSEVAVLLYTAPPRQKPDQTLPNVNANTAGGARRQP
jgi:hypothetical protein